MGPNICQYNEVSLSQGLPMYMLMRIDFRGSIVGESVHVNGRYSGPNCASPV